MTNKNIKTITAVLIALASLFFGSNYLKTTQDVMQISADVTIEELFAQRQSGIMVQFDGVVIKKLSDDNNGSRHQKFIVKMDNRQTVLIAHNIDLAKRVPVDVNQMVSIYGQYEWNDKGGVVHWTHHDPEGLHEGGWIKYHGKIYQ